MSPKLQLVRTTAAASFSERAETIVNVNEYSLFGSRRGGGQGIWASAKAT